MNLEEAVSKRKDMEKKVITKALEDKDFLAKLKKDPKGTLEAMSGKPIPNGVNVKVVEEAPNCITIVLPAVPSSSSEKTELSDDALDNVSGGGVVSAIAGIDVIVSVF